LDAFPFAFGVLVGRGGHGAELPNSFLKRQLDVAPGRQATGLAGAFFHVLDQIDVTAGAWLVLALARARRRRSRARVPPFVFVAHQAITGGRLRAGDARHLALTASGRENGCRMRIESPASGRARVARSWDSSSWPRRLRCDPPPVPTKPPSSPPRKDRLQAMVKNDLEALGRMLPDDFTYTHASGVADTKASLLASLKAGRLKYKSIDPGQPLVARLRQHGHPHRHRDRAGRLRHHRARAVPDPLHGRVREEGGRPLAARGWQSTRPPAPPSPAP
jgi:hypothetical protein